MKFNIYYKIQSSMDFNLYQIIGAIIYIPVSVIVIITIWFVIIPLVVFMTLKVFLALIILLLIPTPFYALVFLLNGVLGRLFEVKERSYSKKDEKYTLNNDFTSMFESKPEKKD